MQRVSIREAKAQLSSIVDAAAKGESRVITNHGRPVAVIGPFIEDAEEKDRRSDLASFKQALLSLPYDLGF